MTSNKDDEPPTPTYMATPTTQVCRTSGHEVYFYDYGGTGPTIIFAHAASFHGRIWDQTISQLHPRYRCVTFDFRGHGQSSGSATAPSTDNLTWTSLFADIPDVVKKLKTEGPLLGVGHSLGGAGLLSTQINDPSLFSALWTYEPIVFEPNPFFRVICENMASATEGRKPRFDSANEAIDNFSYRPPFDDVDPKVLADYVEHGFAADEKGIQLRCQPDTEATIYRNGADLNIFDKTSAIDIDVCVAIGSTDPQAIDFGQKLASNIPSGTFTSLDGLGHLGPLESPSQTAMSISRFFGSY